MMTESAWSHLPNAHYIDWVIQSAKDNPELWLGAWKNARGAAWQTALATALEAALEYVMKSVKDGDLDENIEEVVRDDVWYATTLAANDDAWQTAWGSALDVVRGGGVWGPACQSARDIKCDISMYAAWDAILALVAWDSAGEILIAKPEHIETLARQGDPKAVLLLPAATVWAKENVDVIAT